MTIKRPVRYRANASKKRDKQVIVRLNADELKRIDERAPKSRAKYMRDASLDNLPAIIPELNREAYIELSRLASNLNQISKKMNAINHPDFHVEQIKIALKELQEIRRQMIGLKA